MLLKFYRKRLNVNVPKKFKMSFKSLKYFLLGKKFHHMMYSLILNKLLRELIIYIVKIYWNVDNNVNIYVFYTSNIPSYFRNSCSNANYNYTYTQVFRATPSLVQWSACLTTDHEVVGSIPGTSTNFKCGLGREDNWVAT